MRIGIIGSGNIGGTLAVLLSRAGHEVTLANRRGPDSIRDQVAAIGPRARAGTIEEAAATCACAARAARPATRDRLAIPIAGDDPAAKEAVGALISEIGFDTVDAGLLADGRRQQPGTPVYNQPFTAELARAALAP